MSVLDAIGDTPLVRLSRLDRGLAQPVLGKCEHLNPGGGAKEWLLPPVGEGQAQIADGNQGVHRWPVLQRASSLAI